LETLELRGHNDVRAIDWIRLRVTVLAVATLKTAVITSELQGPVSMDVEHIVVWFLNCPIAHWLPVEVIYGADDGVCEVDRLGEVEVQAVLELHCSEMLAEDPSTIDNGLLRLEFQWSGAQYTLSITQHELVLVLQNGAIFEYRTIPTALARRM
jgi:hypothetical protein